MKNLFVLIVLSSCFAFAQQPTASTGAAAEKPAQTSDSSAKKVDMAAAYYHFTMAHTYEEEMIAYGRSDLVSKAIDEYKLAIAADPASEYLTTGLADLYSRTGRIRDAVTEAQDILKHDPNSLEAHRLLGHIYLRSLGDMQGGGASDNVLKLAIEQYQQIVKLDPNSVDDHMMLGRLYQADNQLAQAEAEEKTAVKLAPESEDAVMALAMMYDEQGDPTKAAETLVAVPENNRSAKIYAVLGATYDQQKDYRKAIDAYRHAVELDRDNLDAIRGLADALMNDGQIDKALEQYQVIADANPEDARTYVRIAEIYRQQGKLDQALQNLKKAQSMVRESDQISYELAEVYQAQGRYDDAISELQGLLKSSEKADNKYTQDEQDNRALFLERLGSAYRDSGNQQAALDTFQKMLTLGDENEKRGYREIIDTYRNAKEWQKATDAARQATQKLPKDRELQMVYASQLADIGQGDAALQQVKALLTGGPEDREVYLNLATMYDRLKRWPDAEAALDKAEPLSTKQEDKDTVEYMRASIYGRQKKYDQAEALLRKILTTSPDNVSVLNDLGYIMADRGEKLDEALTMIRKAVDVEPTNGAYLDSLGWVYFKLGKYDLAEDNLIKASQHQMSDDPTVQEHLGDLYQKTGRLKLAAAHWQRSVDEWNKTVGPEVDQEALAKVQKKLESAKVRLAQENKQ